MGYFSARVLSHWRSLVALIATVLAPYLLGLARDAMVWAGIDWTWSRIAGPPVIRETLRWMGANPVSSIVLTAVLWVSFWAVLTHIHLRSVGAKPTETPSRESVLERVTVRRRGTPQVVLRQGSQSPRFILLPSVQVANGSERAISLSFQLMIDIVKNTSAGYEVMGEPLPQWETVKQFQLVEHINQHLPVPLDLEPGRSNGGYLTFCYTGVRFTDSPTTRIFYVNVHDLDRPIRDMRLQLTELHSNARRDFHVGCIDVRQLLEPESSTVHTEDPPESGT